MTSNADGALRPQAWLAEDVRTVAWCVLVGAGAGGAAGFLVGGVGGRLAMLVLRLTSPDAVIGVVSDDGFVIGQVTTDTVSFLFAMAFLGGLVGVVYATLRTAIPARLRLPLSVAFAGLVGGSLLVHDDGVDFTLVEPAALAIALFVAIPAVAMVVIVLLVERWTVAEPWGNRRLNWLVTVAALASSFALTLAAIVVVVGVIVRRVPGLAAALQRVGLVLVPVAGAALALVAGVDLVQESQRILE